MTEADAEGLDLLAAEYVLGTLDAQERARARALCAMDPGFAAAVRAWERWLGELHVLVAATEPPPEIWDRIKAGIAGVLPGGAAPASELAGESTGFEGLRAPAAGPAMARPADEAYTSARWLPRWIAADPPSVFCVEEPVLRQRRCRQPPWRAMLGWRRSRDRDSVVTGGRFDYW